MFQAGLVLFSLGSLLCSVAPGLGWLIAFRALQAVGLASTGRWARGAAARNGARLAQRAEETADDQSVTAAR